jgi:type II secretory pathway pseudopilin PulG
MNGKKGEIKNGRQGMVLVIAVVIIMILVIIGTGLLQLGRNARLQAVKDVLQISARSAADAGIEHAVRYMINSWNAATNKTDWLALWEDPNAATPNYSFGPASLPDTFGNAAFTYNIYKGTRATGYGIVSTGTAGRVTRTVHAATILKSTYFGIGAKENINVNVGAGLGTIPVGDTLVIQTNSTTSPPSGGIVLRNGLNVPGDVICGPGGDTDIAIVEKKDVVITGDVNDAEDYIPFPPIHPPDPPLPAGSWIVNPNDPTKATISSDMQLSSLTVGSPQTVTTLYITGDDIDIYVTGNVLLSSGANLIVTKNSELTLYLGSSLDVKNGSYITYEGTPANPDPVTDEALIIEAAKAISIKGTDTCQSVKLYNSGNFYGAVYAPEAGVEIGNTAGFYGVACGETIDIKNSGVFMYIPSLYDFPDVEVLYMGIKRGSWWEE